jgi:hypothetical protein
MQKWAAETRKHQPWNALERCDIELIIDENEAEGGRNDSWSITAECGSELDSRR